MKDVGEMEEEKPRTGRGLGTWIRTAAYALWFIIGIHQVNKFMSAEDMDGKIDALASIIYCCFFLGLAVLGYLDHLLHQPPERR